MAAKKEGLKANGTLKKGYRWGKGGFKEIYSLCIYLITTGILLISIYGMR